MGLLDFLKKKPSAPGTASPHDPATTEVAKDAGSAAEHSATLSSEPAFKPLAVQPQTVSVPAATPLGKTDRAPEPPATVRAYDEFGRQVEIPFAQWRNMMLAEMERARDEPDRLYSLLVQALQFRLSADALPAAERLHAIDPDRERGTTMLGIVRMETGDAMGAARLFAEFLTAQHQRGEPPSAIVLTNHAKALVAMGDGQAGEAMLWQALEADPNQENGLIWFAAIARDRNGDAAYQAALERVAALPGAWRPQVWLARAALDGGGQNRSGQNRSRQDRSHLDIAKALYRQALERAGSPAPTVLLQSMSGDLGNHGYLQDALALTRPAYVAGVHGLAVGNNLIKASLDTGRLEDAQALVEELQQLGQPDWVETLQYWETEVQGAVLAGRPPLATSSEAAPEVTALAIDGPVWLPGDAPSRALFANRVAGQSSATARQPKLLFLAASVHYAEQPAALQGMLPDAPGRLSRALPLFLAESAYLHMGVETNAIIPWVKGHGFAVMGAEWTDADAAEYARSAGAVAAVVLHIEQKDGDQKNGNQTGEKSEARLRVVRADAAGGQETSSVTVPVDWTNTGAAALMLWSRLANSLLPLTTAAAEPVDPARYQIPGGPALGNYLLRLEQLLAVRCSGTDTTEGGFLSGEREIVRGQLDLALSLPASLPLRLILHETLLRLRTLRPEIVAEFRRPVELLQQRYPLADTEANAILEQQLGKVYPADPNGK